jgi:hypothetical protein
VDEGVEGFGEGWMREELFLVFEKRQGIVVGDGFERRNGIWNE